MCKQQKSQYSRLSSIQTQGGGYIEGDIHIQGGDVVGRDKYVRITNVTLAQETQSEQPRYPFEPDTVLIPAGLFIMGSNDHHPCEGPQHQVMLDDYEIGKYPVTNREYARFIQEAKTQDTPDYWFIRKPPVEKALHPVVGVSWYDAQRYCEWLSERTRRAYRLPTEAEWEKASRGDNGDIYPWGNKWEDDICNVESHDTTPVVQGDTPYYPDGVSPCGCYDTLGNVEEWINTLWGGSSRQCDFEYPYNPLDGREELDRYHPTPFIFRLCRGGSFHHKISNIRCTARNYDAPDSQLPWRGFRIVLECKRK